MGRPVSELSKEDLGEIRVVCFDGDGVTKKKGTEFKDGQMVATSAPTDEMMNKLVELSNHVHVTISSGRGIDYLKAMYQRLLDKNASLQAEIGMYLCWQNNLYKNYDLDEYEVTTLNKIKSDLEKLKDENIKGFEPKEYLITLHCGQFVAEVGEIVKKYDTENRIYCWWNEEAFDIGVKRINKGTGLEKLVERLGLTMGQVMTVGNGINDRDMTKKVGISISADPKRLEADFVIEGEEKGGEKIVDRLLELLV